jgi:hypothetical protein
VSFWRSNHSVAFGRLHASCNEAKETKVEHLEPAPWRPSIPAATPNWRTNLLWALTGAILGNLLAAPMDAGKDALLAQLDQNRTRLGQVSAPRSAPGGKCPDGN